MNFHFIKIGKPLLQIFPILLLACPFSMSAQDIKVSLPAGRFTAAEIFHRVTEQTGYKFAYDKSVYDASETFDLPATETDIESILGRLFTGKSVKYIVRGNLIVLAPHMDPQIAANIPVTQEAISDTTENTEERMRSAIDRAPLAELQVTELKYRGVTSLRFEGFLPGIVRNQTVIPNPRFALKTNLLYAGATFTPNLALEIALGPKSTLDLRGSYNWQGRTAAASDNHKQRVHSLVGAEYRWWLCERYNGHFFGGQLNYFRYNISGLNLPLLFKKENRYDGHGFGVGASYGYHLPLARRWGVEFNIGVGYMYMDYDRFTCAKCDTQGTGGTKHYIGPTRAGVSFVFMIK